MANEGAKLSSENRDNIILTYPNGDEIIFDHCTKSRSEWLPSNDLISNVNKISKLGYEMVFEHSEDYAHIKQEPESLRNGDNEENDHP